MFDERHYTQREVDGIVKALRDELYSLELRYNDSLDDVSYLNRQISALSDCHDAMVAFLDKEGIDWNCEIY